ncbi:MAG: Gfo/Idh/MocA family oxidoreductase, partial [Natronospirillum sp.]
MATSPKRIRLGMLGGGQGALIGGVHRFAARLDDRYQLVAGVFSQDASANSASAVGLGVSAERCYDDYETLIRAESTRRDGVEVVAIVTPNHLHFPMAMACVQAGLHVICEKPMTISAEEAEQLAEAVAAAGVQFVLMHNYSGYPLVQHARDLVARGELGAIRSVQVEYAQEWLTEPPAADNKQAAWRLDPAKAGA